MNSPSHEQHVQDSPSISTKSRATPLATPTQTRQTKVQFANSSTYLSYELGQAVKALPPLYTRLLAGSISLAIFGTVAWAAIFKIDDTADAPGTIVPSEYVKPITAMAEGKIKSIAPQGRLVKAGDVVFEVDTTLTQNKIKDTKEDIKNLQAEISKIKSNSFLGKREEEKKINEQIVLKTKQLQFVDKKIGRAPIAYDPYFNGDKINKELERKETILSEIKILKRELKSLRYQDYSGASGNTSKVGDIRQTISQKNKELDQLNYDLQNATIKAPVPGRVYNIEVSKSQGHIQKGKSVLSISPDGKPLVMFAEVKPKDRKSIYSGMAVKVKLESDQYKKADLVPGKLIDIGVNTIKPEGKSSYYEATIKLDNPQELQPGTRATAMIIKGRRTILQKVLAPIMNTADDAATGL